MRSGRHFRFDATPVDWTRSVSAFAGPRYLAIVKAIENALGNGSLKPGDRLPAQRDLAGQLSINIGTVTRAYAVMRETGVISGEVGRGTFINKLDLADGPRSLWDRATPRPFIDLSHSFPDDAPIHPAISEILNAWTAQTDVAALLARQVDTGLLSHRRTGAGWLARFGLDCGADDVMITCGSQHGLMLAMAALSRPGDIIMTEELAFYGLKSAASMMGRSLMGIRMDEQGLTPDHLEIICRRTGAKVLFCTPTLHNPTTSIMPLQRREEVLQVCRRHDVMIVEDDVWNFLLDLPAVPFAVLDPERTVYITSFSKIIGPGVRIGLLRMPRQARHSVGVALRATTLMASPLIAECVMRLLASPSIDQVVDAIRSEARARQKIITAALPANCLVTKPEAFFARLKLTNGWSADSFARAAHHEGVGVTPFNVFEVASLNHSDSVRISLNAAPNRSALEHALSVLRTILTDETPSDLGQNLGP